MTHAVPETPVALPSKTYRYRDEEKRRRYQKVLMQLRRALANRRACEWPPKEMA
jgi:hypothetical protein